MYERMLDKQVQPSFEEFAAYCGECRELFLQLNHFLVGDAGASSLMRFPYGNGYGWGIKYAKKSKHICDLFAENGSFTVMVRLSDPQFAQMYDGMSDYTKEYIDHKYPCGDGGWIHYRVLNEQHLSEVMKLLQCKISK